VKESANFISLWNDAMARDPLDDPAVVLQIGLAMLLDRPIIVIAPHGSAVPENVRRVAKSIKFYNPADLPSLEHATKAALTEAGILPEM